MSVINFDAPRDQVREQIGKAFEGRIRIAAEKRRELPPVQHVHGDLEEPDDGWLDKLLAWMGW